MPRRNNGPHVSYRKDRNAWEVREFRNGKPVRLSGCFSSIEECQGKLAEIISAQKPKSKPDKITVGEILAYYLTECSPHLARPDVALYCNDRLAPFWGDKLISEITKGECQKYERQRREEFKKLRMVKKKPHKEMSNDSIRRELEHLQACIGFAYGESLINIVPAVWKPEKAPARSRWLTKKEAAKLLRVSREMRYANKYLPLFILMALYTGARKTAILELRWAHVDLNAGFIDFRSGQVSKTKVRSAIPIPKRLLRELKKARIRGTDLGYVIHDNQKPLGDIKKGFGEACRLAGLDDVTPHTLRHTAASWMVQNGVPVYTVAKYLGQSARMTEQIYGHMSPDHLREAAESYG